MSSIYELDEKLDVSNIKTVPEGSGQALSVTINGKEYRYVSDKVDTTELHRKFKKMSGFSPAKALAWLRKNAIHYYGGKNPKKDVDMDQMKLESTLTKNEADGLAKSLVNMLFARRRHRSVKRLVAGDKLTIGDWLSIGNLILQFISSLDESAGKDNNFTTEEALKLLRENQSLFVMKYATYEANQIN